MSLIEEVLKNLEQGEKVLESGRRGKGVTFSYLPKGIHRVRPLPDKKGKLFASARVHTLKVLRQGEEGEYERNVTVLCGRGPDGSGHCPICEYVWKKYDEEGKESSASWIAQRPYFQFTFYVYETDTTKTYKDRTQWGNDMIVVTGVGSKTISQQILNLLRDLSRDTTKMARLLNYMEEPSLGLLINNPADTKNAQVSWDVINEAPPLSEDKLPEWFKDEEYDVAKAGPIDLTKEPSVDELKRVLEEHLAWKARKDAEREEPPEGVAKPAPSVESVSVEEEPAQEAEDEAGASGEDTPPWEEEDDVERTPAKQGDPKPKCFGHYVASEECSTCAYLAECIEARAEAE